MRFKMEILYLLFLVSSHVFAECKISLSNESYFVNCNLVSGYVSKDERTNVVEISYTDEKGTSKLVRFNSGLYVSQLDFKNLSELMKINGVNNYSKLKIENVSFFNNFPIYKDPELQILKQGCHFKVAPILISMNKIDNCQKILCSGDVECIYGKKRNLSESLCTATITKESAICPSASECLADNSVSIEQYVAPTSIRSSKPSTNSKAARQ